jgi:hypothetical protein
VAQKYDFFRVKKDFLNNFFQPKIKIFLYLCEVREQGTGNREQGTGSSEK